MANGFVHHEKVYNLQMKTLTKKHYTDHSLVFGKQKTNLKNIFHHKVKNPDFKT